MVKSKRMVIGIIAAILLILGLFLNSNNSPTDIIKAQLSALHKNEFTTAYSFFSKEFQANTQANDFEKFINATPSLKNNDSISIKDKIVKGDTATINGVLIANDDLKTPVEYKLIKENGNWKIQGMNLNP